LVEHLIYNQSCSQMQNSLDSRLKQEIIYDQSHKQKISNAQTHKQETSNKQRLQRNNCLVEHLIYNQSCSQIQNSSDSRLKNF
jgi:hypothetical protein